MNLVIRFHGRYFTDTMVSRRDSRQVIDHSSQSNWEKNCRSDGYSNSDDTSMTKLAPNDYGIDSINVVTA
jgi:hypothetical protein